MIGVVPFQELHMLLAAAQVSYRFLGLEPRVFCEQWDWSCFLDLVYSTADCSLVDNSLYNVGLDLRWCTIQILLVVLKESDKGIESFGLGADEAFTCFLRFVLDFLLFFIIYIHAEKNNFTITTKYGFRWKEFCMDTSIEKASLYLQNEDGDSKSSVDGFTSLTECLPDWPEIGRENSVGSNAWCVISLFFPLFFFWSVFALLTFLNLCLCQSVCAY